ncbi:MAG: DNA-processing protein DprA [Alphaproteobacteria bacterium]
MHDLFNKLLILRTPGIGPVKYNALIQKFGSVDAAAESLNADIEFSDSIKREMDLAESLGIKYICDDESFYPKLLREIKNHPPVLSVRGDINTLSKKSVAMVGTRHASAAGLLFMENLANDFVNHEYVVVSGMAMGTDTAAHTGALRGTGDLQTIAVLAGGADYIWPLENERLYNYIIQRGAVISEMPVGSKPIANNFIQRNRLIAGISEKLILGEADLKSGSMTTAGFALDYERPVYAIPSHPSDERAAGPNRLIKQKKAILCQGRDDFFQNDAKKENKKLSPKNDSELLDKIGIIPVSESVLTQLVKKSVSEIKCELIILELSGKIKKTDMGYVKL